MHHSIVFYNGAKVNYTYGMDGEKLNTFDDIDRLWLERLSQLL